ncbi:3-oxoacyl-[acyl-carrier-protein] synthase 3 protein 1 [Bryobacterales bacterium F-183]|nr:3-oxoacyl-[acyl-carrier-protein] synthase 3 protein 1 [Bryobacterales bacterium F-183]
MAFIRGFGAYVPSRIVTNEELATRIGKEASWIKDVSGIEERRWADPDVTIAALAKEAALDCLSRSGVDASEIGLVIVSSGSNERRFPGAAAEVAKQLGLTDAPAIDIPAASAGTLMGLSLARDLAPRYGNVLVIGSEKMSAVIDREPMDANTGILFGDGAGACIVSADKGRLRIVDSILRSDGSYTEALNLGLTGTIVMNGMTVIMQASRKVPSAVLDLLARNKREASSIDWFVMHQANQNLIARIAKAVGVETEKFYSNISRYGNTSSASMLIAASECWEEAKTICFAAFGAGFHWGALLAEAE